MARTILHGDLVSITLSKLIASFGRGLVVVFIPLLLLSNGLKLWHVCAFYAAYAACKLLVNYPSAKIINHYGARLGLIIGTGATVAFMLLLTLSIAQPSATWPLAVMALAMALQNSFSWNSEHLFISRAMNMERKSRDLATIESFNRIVGVATPVVGGFIAAFAGQAWLTAIAAVILAIAIIPIWRIDDTAGGHKKDDGLRYSLRFAPVRDVVANFGFNAHTLVGVMVWPIYLAVFVPDFRSIGIITTIASLAAVVVLQIAGKRGDSGKSYRVLVEGTAGSSAMHVLRILASSNPFTITVISALYDVVLGYQQNPWTSLYYAHTRKGGINYIMSMEIAGDAAYLLLWSILGVIAYVTGNGAFFTVAFGAAAVLAWLCLFMRRETPVAAATTAAK
jgi:MFS family permease